MIENPNPKIDKLRTLSQEQINQMFARVFNSGDGELCLEHLRAKFWKYVPPRGEYATGQQSVVMEIENTINNQTEGAT